MTLEGRISRTIVTILILGCVSLVGLLRVPSAETLAQPPPPPTKTAIPPVTDTPTATPTPTTTGSATPTPTATGSATPTSSASPTATSTSSPTPSSTATFTPTPSATPTPTRTPTQTGAPPAATPTHTPTPKRTREPQEQPQCQSIIEGDVFNAAGQRAPGATVRITATGYSNQMLTNDAGHYGFGGLCAGTYTLQATLVNGRLTAAANVTVNGSNSVRVDLRVAVAATATSGPTRTGVPATTGETGMPTTGYSGWLLFGGAALGGLLLLSAGVRRLFDSRSE